MTQEDKELLLKDLCGRLPYEVKAYAENVDLNGTISGLSPNSVFISELHDWWDIEFIKPYLRPMSKMIDEEKEELLSIIDKETKKTIEQLKNDDYGIKEGKYHFNSYLEIEFLLSHHFDYRGLIEKGLALEAPADMYNIKEK